MVSRDRSDGVVLTLGALGARQPNAVKIEHCQEEQSHLGRTQLCHSCCVTLSNLLHFSGSQFLYLQNGKMSMYLPRILWILNEVPHKNCLTEYLSVTRL